MRKRKTSECVCDACVGACANGNPGWFLPGEAQKAAKLLKMSFKDFKNKYLVIDFWCGKEEIEILTPLKVLTPSKPTKGYSEDYLTATRDLESRNRGIPGKRVTWGYGMLNGRCVFLDKKNRCMIHEAKPYECAISNHDSKFDDGKSPRETIVGEWEKIAEEVEKKKREAKKKRAKKPLYRASPNTAGGGSLNFRMQLQRSTDGRRIK